MPNFVFILTFFQDGGIVQRIDVFDLKLIPLASYHVNYITSQIDNKELLLKVKQFEKQYDIKKQPYPIATETQLRELISFVKKSKPGFFISRITTMFELLNEYRTFTLGQLEFRKSVNNKTGIKKILKRIPMLLSKSALLKRMKNSGHFSIDNNDEEINNSENECAIDTAAKFRQKISL